MGVKRSWKIKKLTQLDLDESTRNTLITDILRRKKNVRHLYAWDVNNGVAKKAFFLEKAAIRDWFLKNRLWESSTPPKGVTLHVWEMTVPESLKYVKNKNLVDVPISEDTHRVEIGLVPPSLYVDIQQTLKKQP